MGSDRHGRARQDEQQVGVYIGDAIRFSDYIFGLRARLGLLALSNRQYGPNPGPKQCRECAGERETPFHVLSRFPVNGDGMCGRHDAVVRQLLAEPLNTRREEGKDVGP